MIIWIAHIVFDDGGSPIPSFLLWNHTVNLENISC